MDNNKLRWYTPKLEQDLDLHGPRLIEPVNDRFVATVDYKNYPLPNNQYLYENYVAKELKRWQNTFRCR